jgi:hypothetical protein
MKLSVLAVLLGLLAALPAMYGVAKPSAFGNVARRFPRYTPVGYLFMITATLWFLLLLKQESIADFAAFKPALYTLFAAVGLGACLFVKDFLPVRGLAVLYLGGDGLAARDHDVGVRAGDPRDVVHDFAVALARHPQLVHGK